MKYNPLSWFSLIVVDFGLLFTILAIFGWGDLTFFLDPKYISDNTVHLLTDSYDFALGFGGAVMIGWGITLYAISQNYTKEFERYILLAAGVWFVLDSINTITSGFYLNLVVNLVFIIVTLIIVRMMRKELSEKL